MLPARSHAAAPSGSRLPDGSGRGWVACSERRAAALIRVEQHPLGPRVYVFGQRIHEVALGLGLLAALALGVALHLYRPGDAGAVVGGVGAWLVAKDWRDLFPRWRNTQMHRRFGLHLHGGPRIPWRLDLPTVVATATLAVAAVNAASALTPNVGWRGHALLRIEPVAALPVFHAIALPACIVLGLTAMSLRRRRRRALHLAIVVLGVLAVSNVLKGLDVEEAGLCVGLAAALWYGRGSFDVDHEPLGLGLAAVPVLAGGVAVLAAAAVSAWVAGRADSSAGLAGRESAALLAWKPPPLPVVDGASMAIRSLMVVAFLTAASVFFRPRRPAVMIGSEERGHARALVREYGKDTLSAFKLRGDLDYLFARDARAFVGYRVELGVLLVAGDPVGADDAIPGMIAETRAFASAKGLRLGGIGVSASMARHWRDAGLRSIYIGDEAIVDTGTFSLEGRPMRKVRQSVTRLVTAGFTVSLETVAALDEATRDELDAVSSRWREGRAERGFVMTMEGVTDSQATDGVTVIARDPGGCVRGWIQFVPTYGRAAMSLALMRRDRETPNGLMEFLVVRSIELLRERGIAEVSLNFAAFARPLRSPHGVLDMLARALLAVASRWFQIESLYRFNAKFFPRWEPRYLVYSGSTALPAIGLATLVAEGQAPQFLTTLLRAGAPA